MYLPNYSSKCNEIEHASVSLPPLHDGIKHYTHPRHLSSAAHRAQFAQVLSLSNLCIKAYT